MDEHDQLHLKKNKVAVRKFYLFVASLFQNLELQLCVELSFVRGVVQ